MVISPYSNLESVTVSLALFSPFHISTPICCGNSCALHAPSIPTVPALRTRMTSTTHKEQQLSRRHVEAAMHMHVLES